MTSKYTFGPTEQSWHYTPASKTYDLTHGSSAKKMSMSTTEGPEGTFLAIAPETSALVIVDMQNYFLDPSCMEHTTGLAAVEPTIRVIEKCREIGIQIIWLNWGLTDTDMASMPAGVQRGFLKDTLLSTSETLRPWVGLGADLGGSKGRCLFADTWNADIYPSLKAHVQPSDLHCAKNRMSGLWSPEQPLWKTLKTEGKTTCFFAGVNTDQCVLGTFVDAYNAGWDSVIIDDCCGTPTPGAKEVTLDNIANCYGFVTNSKSFVNAKIE